MNAKTKIATLVAAMMFIPVHAEVKNVPIYKGGRFDSGVSCTDIGRHIL